MAVTILKDGQIQFTEQMSTSLRIFLCLVGLLPWMAPYELLIKPGWTGFHVMTILFIIISLGAIAISLAFIGGAIFGLDQTLTIDPARYIITHAYESAVIPLRVRKYTSIN
jgi:hypothetical protein